MNYHIIFDSSYEAFGFSLDALLSIIDAGDEAYVVGEWLSERDVSRLLWFLENRRCYNRVFLEIILNIVLKTPIIFWRFSITNRFLYLFLFLYLLEIFWKIMIYNILKINFDNGNDEMKDCNTNLILSFNVIYLWLDDNFFNPRYIF